MTTKPNPLPSAADLREVFDYFPETGEFVWKDGNLRAGWKCGREVRYKGIKYLVYRLIYVWWHGDLLTVDDDVDHADLDNSNNKIGNLRKATRAQNVMNSEKPYTNSSGAKGVDQLPGGRWRVRIAHMHMGTYASFEDAVNAYNVAAERLYGEFGRPTLLRI